jgi:hypothetical protein
MCCYNPRWTARNDVLLCMTYGDGLAVVPTATVVGVLAAVVQFLVRRISFVEMRNGGKAASIVSPTIYLLAGRSRTPN